MKMDGLVGWPCCVDAMQYSFTYMCVFWCECVAGVWKGRDGTTYCRRSRTSGGEFLRAARAHKSGEMISLTASRISDLTSLVISLAKSFKYSATSAAETLSPLQSSALKRMRKMLIKI